MRDGEARFFGDVFELRNGRRGLRLGLCGGDGCEEEQHPQGLAGSNEREDGLIIAEANSA